MEIHRIKSHPILEVTPKIEIPFYWKGELFFGHNGETIASALYANGVHILGYHPKDGSPQGIFCANGQCAQCLVLVNGKPLKACTTLLSNGVNVQPIELLPSLPEVGNDLRFSLIEQKNIDVLIIGGGPAGLSAARELGKLGIPTLVVDDKNQLGGKLVLQTHRFFGSINAVYAGTRGIDIAKRLENEVRELPSIEIWMNSTALAVFSDQKVGILQGGERYVLVVPKVLLVASGAREKFLSFPGNTLPGVLGAGAFQTLVNRDLIKPCENIFIIGGGNVGLIAGYHALQAGIKVVGLVEALPECSGYKVHKDKLQRLGVPIYTSHTILSANGKDRVQSVTISEIDAQFKPIAGTEKNFACDSVLVAVGLDPVNEFYTKACTYGIKAFAAGDAEEIAEASAAIYSGKIRGLEIARELGIYDGKIPLSWYNTMNILKSKPGKTQPEPEEKMAKGVFPVFHCAQEIPCDPCASICSKELIQIDKEDIRQVPKFIGDWTQNKCIACEKCITICPGLAVTLVDYRVNQAKPIVSIPYEMNKTIIQPGNFVMAVDVNGNYLDKVEVSSIRSTSSMSHTVILRVKASSNIAQKIAGIQVMDKVTNQPETTNYIHHIADDAYVCLCERVKASDIRNLIKAGIRDMNEIKAITRSGMGACGGKTCTALIQRIFRDEGISLAEISPPTQRPIFVEVPLGIFAGLSSTDPE